MSSEQLYLAVVLVLALWSFWAGRLRTDVTALLVLLALIVPWRPTEAGLAPILTPKEGFSGFGSPALIMVAGMFVLSAAMVRTGAAKMVGGGLLARGAASELRFQVTTLGLITLFSAVINDTTAVLIWMPLVVALCRERGYPPGRVLILVAYASLLGGQWTLIGTRSNIILSDYLRSRTGEELGFFSFTPIAVGVWVASLGFFLVAGRRLLPRHSGAAPTLAERYQVAEYVTEAMADPTSELIGKELGELQLAGERGVSVLQVVRGGETLPPSPWLRIARGDVLVLQGQMERITELLRRPGLVFREELQIDEKVLRSPDLRMAEAVVAPGGDVEGKSLGDVEFHKSYGISVLAIQRQGRNVTGRPLDQELAAGDALLLLGHVSEMERLQNHPGLLMLGHRPAPPRRRWPAWVVLGLMAAMVLAAATSVLEPAIAVPVAAVAAMLLRCIGPSDAYEAIDLPALVVVGGMIPFGLALEKTGAAHEVAALVGGATDGAAPILVLAILLLMAIGLTQVIENSAVAVILAPIAYELAVGCGSDPAAFLLAVAICVSAAFMTPVAHESTILVMAAGRYRFTDYLRLGAPLALITWLVTLLLVPLFYEL